MSLRALARRYPKCRFIWLMGADNLAQFHRWRGWLQIMELMPMAVIARPGSQLRSRFAPAARRFGACRLDAAASQVLAGRPAPAWTYLNAPLDHTSSSAIRSAAKAAQKWTVTIPSGSTYTMTQTINSNETAVYRAVPVGAP